MKDQKKNQTFGLGKSSYETDRRMRNEGIERLVHYRDETKQFNEFVKSVRQDIWANLELRLAAAQGEKQLEECLVDIDREYAVDQKLQEFLKEKKEEDFAGYALDLVYEIGDSALKCLPENPDKSIAPQCEILREEFTRLKEGDMNLTEMLRILDSANKLFFMDNKASIGEAKFYEWSQLVETKRVTHMGAFKTLMEADFRQRSVTVKSKEEELQELIRLTNNPWEKVHAPDEGIKLYSRLSSAATNWNLEMKFSEITKKVNEWNTKVEEWNESLPLLKKALKANQEFNKKLADVQKLRFLLVASDVSGGKNREYLENVNQALILQIYELGADLSSPEKIKNYIEALKNAASKLDSAIKATKTPGVLQLISDSFKNEIQENYSAIIDVLLKKYPNNPDLIKLKLLIEQEIANIESYSQLPKMNAWAQEKYKKNFIDLSEKQVKEFQQVVNETIKNAKAKIAQTDLGSMLQNEVIYIHAIEAAKLFLENLKMKEDLQPRFLVLEQTIGRLEQKAKELSSNWEVSLNTKVKAYDKFLKDAVIVLNLALKDDKTPQGKSRLTKRIAKFSGTFERSMDQGSYEAPIKPHLEKAEAQIKANEALIDMLPDNLKNAPFIEFEIPRTLRQYRKDIEELKQQIKGKDVRKYQKKVAAVTKKIRLDDEFHLKAAIQAHDELQIQIEGVRDLINSLEKEQPDMGQNLANELEKALMSSFEGYHVKTKKDLSNYIKEINRINQRLKKSIEEASKER